MDVRAVVAVGRGEDHAVAFADRADAGTEDVGVRDHAADAARRGRRPRLPVCRPIQIRGDGKAKRVARVGHRVQKSLWYAADLERRLHSRAQDSDQVIRGRMSRASQEMSHWAEYDYIVINHDIDAAFAEVQSILKAERLKRERRTGLSTFVRELQRQLEK